jgi:murein DD-endopeptidase MepM/ murein hydrolase activator NlpD
VIFVAPPDREARLESRAPVIATPRTNQFAKVQGVDNVIVRLQTSLDQVEKRQIAALSSVEDSMESRVRRMRGVFTDLGLDLPQLEAATPSRGVGGPFVPVKLPADAGPFERQLYRISVTRGQVERLNRTLALVPYRKPVIGEVEFTSGFGVRSDPFLGRPAMHTGLDFRAASGDPVRATANGKVVSSGWAGGYGRMVEIDHGNGLSTRYGHLSEIGVKVGDQIKIGQVIGAVELAPAGRSRLASALRDPDRRRRRPRSFARRGAAERRLVPDLTVDHLAEQLPGCAVELHQLHLFDRKEIVSAGVGLDARQHHVG